jgi:hypothetical protein
VGGHHHQHQHQQQQQQQRRRRVPLLKTRPVSLTARMGDELSCLRVSAGGSVRGRG